MLRGRLKMEFSHVYFSLALESKEIIRSFYQYCFYSLVESLNRFESGFINYARNEGEDADVAEKIRACEFEKGWKRIYQGPDVRQALDH